MRNFLAQILPKLPRQPVDKGATWDADLSVPGGPVKVDFKIRYTLAEVAPLALIHATLDTSLTPTAAVKGTIKINKQQGTGKFAFDQASGRLESATIKQSIDMTVNDGSGDRAQTTEATDTFKLIK